MPASRITSCCPAFVTTAIVSPSSILFTCPVEIAAITGRALNAAKTIKALTTRCEMKIVRLVIILLPA